MSGEISNNSDTLDVRDIIARVEELEGERDGFEKEDESMATWEDVNEDDAAELAALTALLDDLKGYGGDEQWRGDWYPLTLVRDSYFEDFAQEEAESLGLIDQKAQWPYTCIDWEQAANELRQDYSTVDFDGTEYLYRG